MVQRYRSKLEKEVHKKLGRSWKYEPFSIPYILVRRYTPDFVKGNKFIEVKGFFRPGDTLKYRALQLTAKLMGKELLFVFNNPNKPLRRGSKTTHGKWCQKHGIRYVTPENINRIK